MHELSLAQNIVDTIQHYVPQLDWEHVTAVRLKVGACSGIMADSLEFSFQVITAHTPLRTAKLEIETVPFRIQCLKCSNVNESDIGDRTCTTCGTKDTKIISGTDLHITEIEVEESKVQQP